MERAPKEQGSGPRKRSLARRTLRVLAWSALALAALLAALYLLRDRLLAPLAVARAQRFAEERYGLVLSIDELASEGLSRVTARGVELQSLRGEGELQFARVERLDVRVDLWRLVSGDAAWLARVEADGVTLRADLAKGAPTSAGAGGGEAFAWPAGLPELELGGLDVEVRTASGERAAFRGGLRVSNASGAARIELDAPRVELPPSWPTAAHSLAGRAECGYAAGVFEPLTVELRGDVALLLSHGRVDLAHGALEFEADLEAFGGGAHLRGRAAQGDFEASYSTRDVELAEALRFAAPALREAPAGRVSVEGEVLVVDGAPAASARGTVLDACVLGRAIDALEADVVWLPDALEIALLDARQDENRVLGRALSVPLDRDTWLETLRASRGELEAELYDLPALAGAPHPGVPRHRLQFGGRLTDQGFELAGGRLATRSGQFTVQRGRVTWSAPGEALLESSRFDVDMAAAFDDLSDLGPILGTERWSGRVRGTLHLAGSLRAPVGELDLAGRELVAAGFEFGALTALARIAAGRLEVQTLSADGPLGRLELSGSYDLAAERFEGVHWSAQSERLAELAPAYVRGGALELQAELSGPLREPTGTFEARARGLVLGDAPPIESIELSGSHGGERVRIDALRATVAGVQLRASGVVQHAHWALPLSILVDSAAAEREGVAFALAAPAQVGVASDGVTAEGVELSGSAGRLSASFRTAGADLSLHLSSDGFDPMPLLAPWLPSGGEVGRATGTADLARAGGGWSANVDLRVAGVRAAAGWPAFDATLRADAADGRASIDELELASSSGISLSVRGAVPFDPAEPLKRPSGELHATARLAVPRAEELPWGAFGLDGTCEGALDAALDFEGRWPDVRGSLDVFARDLRVVPRDPRSALAALWPEPGELSARAVLGDGLVLERLELDAGALLDLALEGTLLDADDARALLEGEARPWRELPLDLRCRWSAADLAFLTALVPGVRRIGGASDGEVALGGTWGAPRGQGTLQLRGGEFRIQQGLPPFEALELRARLDGTRLTLERARGELGAGPFTLAGAVELAGAEPVFDLTFEGRELLLVQQRDFRVRADAELALRGPLSALVLSGALRTRESRWTRNVDWFVPRGQRPTAERSAALFSIASGPFSTLRFDIAVHAAEPLRIVTNIARGGLRTELLLRGSGAAPELSGALFIEPTRVFLPASTLELRSGTLTLDRRAPLNPGLDLALAARVRGYDVTMRVEGRLEQPELELSSTPPLPSQDLMLLLLTGRQPGASLTGDSGSQAAETVIVYLGRDLLGRWFGNDVSLLERVEWEAGADVTQAGGATSQVQIRVSGPAEGEGRSLYLRGEKDVYDRINYGLRFVLKLR